MLVDAPEVEKPTVAIIPMGEAAEARATGIIADLRRAGIACDMGFRGNMKKRMQRANASGALFAAILGDDEIAKGVMALKNLRSGEQQEVPLASPYDLLKMLVVGEGMARNPALLEGAKAMLD